MFTADSVTRLQKELPEFSLDRPCNAPTVPELFTEYFAHYGFFDTLKQFDGDYFFGRVPAFFGGRQVGVALHYWRNPLARGTVLVVHGLFDHVGLFQRVVQYLLLQRYSVIALDLPGHGLSDGAPTAVSRFADYSEAVKWALMTIPDEYIQQPFCALGQSTGAAVIMGILYSCRENAEAVPFAKLVFFGPLIRPRKWRIGRLTLRLFGQFIDTIYRDMSNANSHDTEFQHFLRFHDPLQSRRLHVSWVRALDEWISICSRETASDVPLLIIQGTRDKVVDWRSNLPQLQNLFRNVQVNYVEGAMHHLANEAEPWRQAVFASVGQFLKAKTGETINPGARHLH